MNKAILNIDIQEYINSNLKADISSLLLRGIPFDKIDSKIIIEQIEAKKRCEKKLPTWFNTKNIYYPNKLNIEQTSSEVTAQYKANLLSGNTIIDLTGGFGIDAYYFSKRFKTVTHCEINTELSDLVKYNYDVLNTSNIKCLNENGIDTLKQLNQHYDCVYIDPSRRNVTQQKVFLLSDCSPNIKTFQNLFLKYAKHVIIKTSPLLDLSATLNDLNNVKEVHIVAVNNEVKELLWILERDFEKEVVIKTVNLQKSNSQNFEFIFNQEPKAKVEYSKPLNYLYEPNAAILKAGAFNLMSERCNTYKLHKHSHLYTHDELMDFPGRRFKIEKYLPFNKKLFSKEGINKANITTRNFPVSVNDIRKKFRIKDGGTNYLFFTIDSSNSKVILLCTRV